MEPHLRVLPSGVLPSNAPALSDRAGGQLSSPETLVGTLSLQICQTFNQGLECRACSLLHVCFTCQQSDHGANECKAGILRVTSGNAGSNVLESRTIESKLEVSQSCGMRPSIFSSPGSPYQSHPILRWEQQKHRILPDRLPNYWHCEFETPRYRAYREKCRQKDSKEKWPDRVEEAFQTAIRFYRRRGRKKAVLYGKQSGGNEFIADYIKKSTGEPRCRKQVSSHIQVLKGFLSENERWMSLVVGINPDRSAKQHRQDRRCEESTSFMESEIYDDASNYQVSQAIQHTYAGGLLPPVDFLGSNLYRGPTVRSVEFTMTLYREEPQVALHTYTSIQSEMGSLPRALDDVSDWRTMFPQLAAYCDSGETECPIFLFETELSLMNRYPGGRLTLGTELIIDFTHGTAFTEWCALTRFYEGSGSEIDLSKIYENTLLPNSPYNEITYSEVLRTTDMQLEIPMKSKWWARKFSDFISDKQEAEAQAAAVGSPRIVKEQDQRTRQYLREMSVMQEIWATSRIKGSQPQRMAILLWKFDQTPNREAPTTSWRRIIPPVSPFQVQSPSSTVLQAPITLDSTLEDPLAPHPMHPYADYYNPQPSIVMDPSESLLALGQPDESSPDTPQTGDYRSFPSSTSTSFPSSISNSTYAMHPSHQLRHDSQDSGYPVFGSFDSQDSNYVAAHLEESYESQDNIYHSQDSLYHTVTTPLYEYPTPEYPVPQHGALDEKQTVHDFTGGEIQLHYTSHSELAPTYEARAYEAPLIAPRANMVQQTQVIEHLENFDYHDPPEHHQDLDPDQSNLQQTYAEHFHQNFDLNLLATQFNAWEDQMHSQQVLEHHVDGDVGDGSQRLLEYESQRDQEQAEQRGIMGQGEGGAKELPLESQLGYL